MKNLQDKDLYYVGGVVRDEILGIPSLDIDFCYEGNAIEYAKNNFMSNIVKVNPDFGTVRILLNNKEIDIASTRKETYPRNGHLPLVSNIGCSLTDDLKRRDFTINSIAKNTLSGEITDPFGGKSDIEKKRIKVLHEKSFIEDPTRIVRALKFSVRFGFELDKDTLTLQENYLSEINYDISYHRLKKELIETFNLNIGRAFDNFVEQGLYKLLGKNQNKPIIKGDVIQNRIKHTDYIPWIIYMSCFNLEKLPLTRQEKRIIEWADKLKTEDATNNTPKESILIHEIMKDN